MTMAVDALGDRMKGYERASDRTLTRRMPVIVRVDGKAFHRWTRNLERPFCADLVCAMDIAAAQLCREIQGAQMAYVQSDEISVLVHGYKRHVSTPWLDNRQSKIESITASIAGSVLTAASVSLHGEVRLAYFDSRAFVVPENDVANCFIWRQQDAVRNSIQMLGQSLYSQSALHQKNCAQIQDMIHAAGKNWNALPTSHKRGRCIVRESYEEGGNARTRWVVDNEIPVFTEDRAYIERHLTVRPEDEEPIPRFADYYEKVLSDDDVRTEMLRRLESGMSAREFLDSLISDDLVRDDGLIRERIG
jgi:tRNA(His) guanylyltransferase